MWCHNFCARIIVVGAALSFSATANPAEGDAVRSLRAPLAIHEGTAVGESWPGIACWFWTAAEFEPEGYKAFLDSYAKHTGVELLTTSLRYPVEVTDAAVHDQIKAAAEYARGLGLGIVLDLDVRLARQAFMDRHPDELQEIVRLREVPLAESGAVELTVESISQGDHYTFKARPYDTVSARVLRVYAYATDTAGIDPATVEDITDRCIVRESNAQGVRVSIPCTQRDKGRTACVMAAFTVFTPDVFAPHLSEFERGIMEQYADVPLSGACKDEWGFPGRFEPRTDDLWFSRHMAGAYALRRSGRDLVRDLLLMSKNERGREAERAAAINHYMEMNWQQNAAVERDFYDNVKAVLGAEAMVGTHPTWYAFPSNKEAFKNGLDWWAVKRDLAQTDEGTPFAARTALSKKWRSPLCYNMYYDAQLSAYEEDQWRHTLGGSRMNLHPIWPHTVETMNASLLDTRLFEAEQRIRLLNYISTAAIDCPVAVIFGHARAVISLLRQLGIASQTPCTMRGGAGYAQSMMPVPSGTSRLLDGTIIHASGAKEVTGDPIQIHELVNGTRVQIDAEGVAAYRFNAAGNLEALAVGGLKSCEVGDLAISLDAPADVALWREGSGAWRGVLHGNGDVPVALLAVTENWTRVRLPERYAR